MKLYFKMVEHQNIYAKEDQRKRSVKWKIKKMKYKQTEMKYSRSANAFKQNCTILHSNTNTPHKIIPAKTQKSHRNEKQQGLGH